MTDQERNQVLKLIENGKISPEQALHLMETLDKYPADEEDKSVSPGTFPDSQSEPEADKAFEGSTDQQFASEPDPRISRIETTTRRLWQIPLWIGVAITILSAAGMFAIMHGSGMNFWFYFMILPFLLGVGLVAAAVDSRKALWLYLNIRQKTGEKPDHIVFGLPLPLKLTAWFLRTFGDRIPDLKGTNVDEIIQAVEIGFKGNQPLIVNVDEGENGEQVQIYIG
jgi:hypothetical protein